MTLTTRGALYRLRILLDGEPLYEYRDGLFPRNEQMRTKLDCTVNLPGETAEKNLTLVYEIPDRREYQIPRVYIGTASAVFRHYCLADAFTLAIVFVMLVMSLIAVWISLYSAKAAYGTAALPTPPAFAVVRRLVHSGFLPRTVSERHVPRGLLPLLLCIHDPSDPHSPFRAEHRGNGAVPHFGSLHSPVLPQRRLCRVFCAAWDFSN